MSVSNEFKNITKKIKQQNIKLSICDGELTVKDIHFMSVNVFNKLPVWMLRKKKQVIAKELKYSFDGQLFKTIMKQVEITVKNANEIKDKDINFQYGLFINNKFEYIDLGNYFIKDIEDSKKKDEITVTGYDRMIRFMKTFKQSELQLTYPCKMLKLVQKMCEVCGVELYSTDFYNADLDVEEDFFTAQELTYRDVLEKIAQATLTTAFIEDNKLNLYKVSNDAIEKIDKSYLTDLTIKEKFGPANALVLGRGDVEDNIEETDEKSIAQNGRCEIRFDENEFIEFQRKKVIKGMFEQIKGLEYYSFEASDVGVMWLKPCACIELGDKEDSSYKSYYLKANITINTGISSDIGSDLIEETNTEYKVTTKEEKKTLKVERLAKKNEGLIQDLVEETTENSKKITKHEQDINGITQKVSSVEEKLETVESTANTAKSTADTAKNIADNTNDNLTTNYYTKTETNSQITQKAESITSEVSKTYSTKTETSTAKTEAISSANSSTDNKLKNYTETTKLGTAIEQNYEHVKIAWNTICEYLQLEILKGNASLVVRDENGNLIMSLDKTGQHYWTQKDNEDKNIAETTLKEITINNETKKALMFLLDNAEMNGEGIMAWGYKSGNNIYPVLYVGKFGDEGFGLHLATDLIAHANAIKFQNAQIDDDGANLYLRTLGALKVMDTENNTWIGQIFKDEGNYGFSIKADDFTILNSAGKTPSLSMYENEAGSKTLDLFENYVMAGNIANMNNLKYMSGSTWEASGDKYGMLYCTLRDGQEFTITSYSATSDERLKENIKSTKLNALERIKKINHIQFDWKNTKEHEEIGYIAQELEKIDKNYVFKIPNPKNDDMKYTVRELAILATTTKAVQELNEKVEKQEKIINKLLEKLNIKKEDLDA
ncbi:MAG TPA: tail fiber domain-containing protein [Clostridiaceae bacterium]|nr:tail fiber domain-containing protein [Clostridiaceae bacterium]